VKTESPNSDVDSPRNVLRICEPDIRHVDDFGNRRPLKAMMAKQRGILFTAPSFSFAPPFYNPKPISQPILLNRFDVLMPDVFGGRGVNGVLRDIGGVVAHALETARDKYQI
jgi:hypothetical protein